MTLSSSAHAQALLQPDPSEVRQSIDILLPPCYQEVELLALQRYLATELLETRLEVTVRQDGSVAVDGASQILLGGGICAPSDEAVTARVHWLRPSLGPLEVKAQIPLQDVAPGERARTLAIALAELARMSGPGSVEPDDARGNEPESSPRQTSVPVGAHPTALPQPALPQVGERTSPPSWRLDVHGTMDFRGAQLGVFLGAGAMLSRGIGQSLLLRVAFGLLKSDVRSSAGPVEFLLVTPGVGVEWFLLQGPTQLSIGPSLDVSPVRAQAVREPGGQVQSAVWETTIALRARAALAVSLGGRWSLVTALEVGGTLRPVQWLSLGQPLAELSGATCGGTLGVGWGF